MLLGLDQVSAIGAASPLKAGEKVAEPGKDIPREREESKDTVGSQVLVDQHTKMMPTGAKVHRQRGCGSKFRVIGLGVKW